MTGRSPQPHDQRELVCLAAERQLEERKYAGADEYHGNPTKEMNLAARSRPRVPTWSRTTERTPISACTIPARTTRIASKAGTGMPRQSAAVFRFESASDRIDAAKWTLSGITAIAARRCNRDSHSASRALPKRRIRRGTTSSRGAVAFDREVAFVIGVL